jgi:transposase
MARLRHQEFNSIQEVNDAICPLLKQLNDRPFQKLPGSRASTFLLFDAPALLPLPLQPYEIATFKTVKVNINYHVNVDFHHYSVPNVLIGKELEARTTTSIVEILHRGQCVASHQRSYLKGEFTTVPEHMPPSHRAHKEWTPERLIHWGQSIGMSTAEIVTRLFGQALHPEHGYRACLGLLSLAKQYGNPRLEAACTLALQIGACKFRHIRDILANNRDKTAPIDDNDWVSPNHINVRGSDYYN